jgi:2-C-methyl-D-erythritol 4-phosphate cytidylyltransferase
MDEIISSISHQNRIDCVNGSTTRHRSIALGIEAIPLSPSIPDIVVIHDGARPLVEEFLLKQLVSSAHNYGVIVLFCI